MSRRLQVFVSSTYLDLKEERQASVEAILEAKHIPAGMELFAAGNDSQLEVIKRWIDESDVYMLILGHRYGSIEPKSGKSYTHVEYDYAVSKGKPVFAVVMSEDWLDGKVKIGESKNVREQKDPTALIKFRELVMERMCKPADDRKDIKIAVLQTLADFAHRTDLVGWVRGDADDKRQELEKENVRLRGELAVAERRNKTLEGRLANARGTGGPDWDATFLFLMNTKLNFLPYIPDKNMAQLSMEDRRFYQNASILDLLIQFRSTFVVGVSSQPKGSVGSRLFHHVAPHLTTYGLTEDAKLPESANFRRVQLSQRGKDFLVWLDQQQREI